MGQKRTKGNQHNSLHPAFHQWGVYGPNSGELRRQHHAHRTKKGAGSIVAIQLCGYIPPNQKKLSAPDGMKEIMVEAGVPAVCAVAGIRDVEVDHKEERPDPILGWAKGNDPDLYQFLSRANNNVKKSACKRCVETGTRFDASMLGFQKTCLEGDTTYNPVQKCMGCYWFDVRAFHADPK
jgi:hypothetical protein